MEELTIKILSYPLSDEFLKQEVEKLLHESFNTSPRANIQEVKDAHYSAPAEYILISKNTELVGIQMIFLREAVFENQHIIIGGLGGLCVKEEFRGRGIARQLLSIAMEEMKRLSCDISMLFTNVHNPQYVKLYNTYGFQILDREYMFINRVGKVCKAKSAMIAPINSNEKYNILLNSDSIIDIGAGEW